jgi:glycosyltransferase involved in cell wall biosynthesis
MKILIYSHFYYPEVGAASLRMQYFVNALKSAGYEIKVISPLPNYPKGKIYSGFSKIFQKDTQNNIDYLPIYVPKKHSILKRGASYLSYFISSFLYSSFSSFKPDIVFTSSPPIFTAFGAAIVSSLKGAKLILDLRDIWPDIGIELNLLKRPYVIKILKKVEQFILNKASSIIVTAEGDKFNLERKGVPNSDISVIFNGADLGIFQPLSPSEINKLKMKYEIPLQKTVLIYFGSFNYGMNDIELLADVLSGMEHCKESFVFIAVGEGDNKGDFIRRIENKINYIYFESLNSNELASLIAVADISLIPRKKLEQDTGGNTPVKCFESWASEVPVLLSANKESEITKIFTESEAGKYVQPDNPNEFKNALLELMNNSQLRELGIKGRKFVEDKFDRTIQAQKLLSIIDELNDDKKS